MVNIAHYMNQLLAALGQNFGARLAYVGLQGSHFRGEATEHSDIDVMVVIQDMTVSDLEEYRNIIQSLPFYDKSCGFICSTADLAAWNPMEICNLLHSTKDLYGELRLLVPGYTKDDVVHFAKMSVNNLYHEICHRYIHASEEINAAGLPFSYKSAFFILQTVHYLRSGEFVLTKKELAFRLQGRDKEVMLAAIAYPEHKTAQENFETLFLWCQETMASL